MQEIHHPYTDQDKRKWLLCPLAKILEPTGSYVLVDWICNPIARILPDGTREILDPADDINDIDGVLDGAAFSDIRPGWSASVIATIIRHGLKPELRRRWGEVKRGSYPNWYSIFEDRWKMANTLDLPEALS